MQNFVGKTKCIARYMKVANSHLLSLTIFNMVRLSFLFLYCLHLEIISANIGGRQVHNHDIIRFFMYKETMASRNKTVIAGSSAF